MNTICIIPAYNENSVKLASIIRNELENAGIELKPMHTFVK